MLKIMKQSTYNELMQNINDLAEVIVQLMDELEDSTAEFNSQLIDLNTYSEAKGW